MIKCLLSILHKNSATNFFKLNFNAKLRRKRQKEEIQTIKDGTKIDLLHIKDKFFYR